MLSLMFDMKSEKQLKCLTLKTNSKQHRKMVYFVVITFKLFNSVVVVVIIIIPAQLQYEQFHDSGMKIDFLDSKINK